MYDDILVPTDGSDAAWGAVEEAIDLATTSGSTLHVLHALEVGELPPDLQGDAEDAFEHRGENAVDDVVERARDAGLTDVRRELVRGQPSHVVVDYADDHDVDLIVVGTHGRTGLDRLILGSVTEKVVRMADAPVLTVRHSGDD